LHQRSVARRSSVETASCESLATDGRCWRSHDRFYRNLHDTLYRRFHDVPQWRRHDRRSLQGRSGRARMMEDWVATVSGVTQVYGKAIALDDVSLRVPANKTIGFIGPDGVGKSTLLSMIAGVRKIQSGSVRVLGGDIGDKQFRTEASSRIAYLPQGLGKNLYPTLSIFENIDFFGRLFGQSAEEREWRIDDLLASTDLTPFRDRPAGKLSGGMKQKLGLCCSLIHDPDLLILDEPTTGVDPLARRQFWELIDRIRGRRPQMSVLVATAYMDEAERFEWLVAMNAGKILATGTSQELKERAGQPTLEKTF